MCMRALADYSRALEIEKRTLGEEHVLVAKTKNNMGEALRIEVFVVFRLLWGKRRASRFLFEAPRIEGFL